MENRENSSWPTVVGIVGIVFGALGVLGGLIGAVSSLLTDSIMRSVAPGIAAGQPDVQAMLDVATRWKGLTLALAVVGLAVAAILLVGGIQLVRRRQNSIKNLRIWAAAKMLLVVANAILGVLIQQATFKVMQQTLRASVPAGFGSMIAVFSVVFGLVWGWALPVFLLIWFARQKIKDEVTSWL